MKPAADLRPTPALPDDGVVQRLAGHTIEHDYGFALVGDAQTGELGNFPGIALGDFADDGEDVFPNLFRIMFHPAGLGINLPMAARRLVQNLSARVEEHRLRRGSALVNGENQTHFKSFKAASLNPSMLKP